MQLTFKKQPEPNAPPKPPKRESERAAKSKSSGAKKGKAVPVNTGGRGGQFVLIIGDEGAILVYMQGNKVVRRLFAPSPQPSHTEAMAELMQGNPKVPLSILADVLDQQYVRQTFPPVSSLSVNGLVKRRLDRDFQTGDIRGSLPLGRDKTGRKEWNFLLIALSNTPLIQQWLSLLVEMPNPLKGIFLVPVEAQVYLAMLKKALPKVEKPAPWQLLMSHNKVSGFRQMVAKEGKLVFSRVTQAIDDAIPAVIAGNIEQEILNTIEYLRRLGFQENSGLEVVIIVSQDVMDVLDIKRFGFAGAHVLTPLDVAEMLKLEQAALTADRFGDVVMAAAFAKAKKRILPLSTAYIQKLSQLYLIRKAIMIIATVAVLALLGLAGQNMYSATSDSTAAADTDQKREGMQSKLAELKKSISELNKDVAFKSAVVSTYDAYLKDLPNPLAFPKELAALLTPEQHVSSYTWGPAIAGSKPGTIQVDLTLDFVGNYPDVETLSKKVQEYIALLKLKMPQYDITNDPLPFAGDTQTNQEISFDQQPVSAIKPGQNKIKMKFVGPKDVTPGAAPAAADVMPAQAPENMP